MVVNCSTPECNATISVPDGLGGPENWDARMTMHEAGWSRGDEGGYICKACADARDAALTARMMSPFEHFVSNRCEGEVCRCGRPASHKVEEVIFDDDPSRDRPQTVLQRMMRRQRHPFTAYICCECFRQLMGPAVFCPTEEEG